MSPVKYRSYSQYSQFTRCAYSYYLARIERVKQRPAAWLPMGTAAHEVAEEYELSDRTMTVAQAQALYREVYARDTDKLLLETPNTSDWFASGPYRGDVDIERRWRLGQEHVERYIRWYEAHPDEKPWVLKDGRLAVELAFKIDLGGVQVRGFIDWVGWVNGKLVVRDNKTGNTPGTDDQLKLYGIAVEDYLSWIGEPAQVEQGDFFMTRTGKPTVPYDLTKVTRDEMAGEFVRVDAAIKAGDFPPSPTVDKCRFCSVSSGCEYRLA